MGYPCLITFFVIGVGVIILSLSLGLGVVPAVVKNEIVKNIRLEYGTEQFDLFREIPFYTDFKVFFFNVENEEEVEQGGKPILREIGPYVYKQFRKKHSIVLDNGTIAYYQDMWFEYNEEKSGNLTEDDSISIVNIPMNAMIQLVEMIHPKLLKIFRNQMELIFGEGHKIILHTTVRKVLFEGVEICRDGNKFLCAIITAFPSVTLRPQGKRTTFFSLFNHKNMTHEGRFKINAGLDNIEDIGKIYEWENKTELSFWNNDITNSCNMINGTDGTLYAPFLEKTRVMDIFVPDICRSVKIRFNAETEFQGIKTFEFRAFEEIFEAPSIENSTICFCTNRTEGINQPNGCLRKGTMELYPCLGAHVIASFPHLLWADEEYQSGVIGLKPNASIHQISLEMEPDLAVPLRGGKRAQFNMFIKKVPFVPTTDNLTTTLVPMVWVDEGLELPDEYVELMKDSYFRLLNIAAIVLYTLLAIGIFMTVMFAIFLFKKRNDDLKQV